MEVPAEHGTMPETRTLLLTLAAAVNPEQRGTWPAPATRTISSAARTRLFGAIILRLSVAKLASLLEILLTEWRG